jgi:hypothetical protein
LPATVRACAVVSPQTHPLPFVEIDDEEVSLWSSPSALPNDQASAYVGANCMKDKSFVSEVPADGQKRCR